MITSRSAIKVKLDISSQKEKHTLQIKARKDDENQRGSVEVKNSKDESLINAMEKKLQLERLVKEADIENAKDLFVGGGNTFLRDDHDFVFFLNYVIELYEF